MATIKIAVYAQDSHDYLHSSDHTHLSFGPTKGFCHTYREPMYGQDTGCIDLTTEDSRIIGYIIAPEGSETYASEYDAACLKVCQNPMPYLIHEAVECAKEGVDGLRWQRA